MIEPTDLLPFAIAAAILLVLRRLRPSVADRVREGLESRRAPLVVGVVAFAFYWWFWGTLRQVPVERLEAERQGRAPPPARALHPLDPLPQIGNEKLSPGMRHALPDHVLGVLLFLFCSQESA